MQRRSFPVLLFLTLFTAFACELWAQTPVLLAEAGLAGKSFEVTDTMRAETKYVVNAMETNHLNKKPIEEIDSKLLIKKYVTSLDLSHMFFTQGEVDDFYRRFAGSLPMYLRQGNPYPAFDIFKTYRTVVNKRIDWVMQRLDEVLEFETDMTYEPVRKEKDWPANLTDSNKLWTKRLKYELLNEILTGEDDDIEAREGAAEEGKEVAKKKTQEELLAEAKENVKKRYEKFKEAVDEIDPHEVHELFLTTLMHQYDSHSYFFSVESVEDFSMQLHNALVGIGTVLTIEDNYVTVRELLAGGPAEKSGQLGPNDQIIAVGEGDDGKMVDIVGWKLRKAVKLIRGREGSIVRLLIKPAGKDPSARKIVKIMREEIKLTANLAQAELYEIEKDSKVYKIGMVDIPSFYAPETDDPDGPSTTRDVAELIEKMKKMGVEGIVLDLRRNGGGLLVEAVSLTGLFIPVGPVVHVQNAKGNIREYLDMDPETVWDGPLVILVSKYSASSSEIFTGALKSYKRAIVVGDTSTHGKGTVQVFSEIARPVFPLFSKKLGKLGATSLTFQKWYLPDGSSTQLRGVPSDIVIPSINEFLPVAESDLDNPIPWDTIEILPWSHQEFDAYTDTVKDNDINTLKQLSERRQQELKEFSFLKENIEHFRKRQDKKIFSLNLEKRTAERQKDRVFRDLMEARLKALARNNFKPLEVRLDIVGRGDEQDNDLFEETQSEIQDALQGIDVDNDDDIPPFDIYMREAVRIMADYLHLKKGYGSQIAANGKENGALSSSQ